MPRIVTRAEWKARPPKEPFAVVPPRVRAATCIHHDGPAPITVRTFEEACALVRRDEAYHIDTQGWAGIGYNYLVISAAGTDVDGLIFEARGRDAVGAHCLNHNTEWLGIQIAIGGGQQPSPAALASARWLHESCEAAAGHSLAMRGHQDGYPTACPDPILMAWVRAGMPVKAGIPPVKFVPPVTKPPAPKPTGGLKVNSIDLSKASNTNLVRGSGVKPLQRLLGIPADGLGGAGTRAALHAYQVSRGLNPDSVFGPATATAMLAGR